MTWRGLIANAARQMQESNSETFRESKIDQREPPVPITFFFAVLPFGISNGFLGVTLPFVLTKAGFSVAAAGAIVALGQIWNGDDAGDRGPGGGRVDDWRIGGAEQAEEEGRGLTSVDVE